MNILRYYTTKQLQKFDSFEVYEEVPVVGQPRLGINWVLTEKVKEDETVVKARLVDKQKGPAYG